MSEQTPGKEDPASRFQLPAPLEPLSAAGQIAVKCAECILSRFTDGKAEALPGILISYIPPCTKQPRPAVANAFNILRKAGFVTAQQLPPDLLAAQLYGSANKPLLFVPRTNGDDQFFRPQRQPGCERTVQNSIVDTLGRFPRKVLEHVAHLALKGSPINRAALRNSCQVAPQLLTYALRLFVQTDVLAYEDRSYRLTARGLWLIEGLPTGPQPNPSPSTGPSRAAAAHLLLQGQAAITKPAAESDEPPQPPERLGLVGAWIFGSVESLHSQEPLIVIRAIQQLIHNGVLKVYDQSDNGEEGAVGNRPTTFKWLNFSEDAIAHTSPAERKAIAAWKKLDRLLYTTALNPIQIAQELGLRSNASVDEYTEKVIYRRLVKLLTDKLQPPTDTSTSTQ